VLDRGCCRVSLIRIFDRNPPANHGQLSAFGLKPTQPSANSGSMSPVLAAQETGSTDEPIQTILVVEDEVLIRLPLAEYLRECGYRVFEASSVNEAKAVLDADTPVDLVFSDVNMPRNENGFVLAIWIRQHHPNTAIMLTSGIANAAEKAGDLCTDGPLLTKPYTHDVVLQRIQNLLRQRSTR
jgi:CheY-like chemotaxis protein